MDWRLRILWVDGFAGTTVGLLILLTGGWLAEWYGLPRDLLWIMGGANLTYGTYSLSLAARPIRPLPLLALLVAGNLTWVVLCLRWAVVHVETASVLGKMHLLGEALIVATLAVLEWRWRRLLRTASG